MEPGITTLKDREEGSKHDIQFTCDQANYISHWPAIAGGVQQPVGSYSICKSYCRRANTNTTAYCRRSDSGSITHCTIRAAVDANIYSYGDGSRRLGAGRSRRRTRNIPYRRWRTALAERLAGRCFTRSIWRCLLLRSDRCLGDGFIARHVDERIAGSRRDDFSHDGWREYLGSQRTSDDDRQWWNRWSRAA